MRNLGELIIVGLLLLSVHINLFAQSYEVTIVGPDNLGSFAINDSTQVCGSDLVSDQAFLWENGNYVLIPNSNEGTDVNNFGKVCGSTWIDVIRYSFIYDTGVTTLISPLGGERCNANAINDNGVMTGRTTIGPDLLINHPFIYDGNVMTDIGTLGGPEGVGVDINNSGWVVGSSYTNNSAGSRQAFIYKGSVIEQLQVPTSTVTSNTGGINNAGKVCGNVYLDSLNENKHAVKWDEFGNVSFLPILPGFVESSTYAINDQDDIVGEVRDSTNYPTAVLWRGNEIINLNDEIDPTLGINLTFAYDINNQGQILCWGSGGGGGDFILTPIDTLEGFIVNKTSDESDADLNDGECDIDLQQAGNQCTCRAAIEQANHDAGADVISFNIPGSGIPRITPDSPLPTISSTITMDGTTQAGGKYVEIDGSSAGSSANGLNISADNCEIRGLIINNFEGDGIKVTGNSNIIVGNIIGTDKNSATGLGNVGNGISIANGSNNIVGNPAVDEINVIAGNSGNGILITGNNAEGNWIKSNYIGTDTLGTDGLGNGEAGIEMVDASGENKIGIGLQQLREISGDNLFINFGNVISRNKVAIKIFNTNNSVVIRNLVGLFKSPFGETISKLGSIAEGILITDSEGTKVSECTIGGTGGDGIRIKGLLSKFNKIVNTYIGTDSSGTLGLGCEGNGICIDSLAKGNSVGGCGDDSTVTIAGNNLSGILLRNAALQQNVDTLFNHINNVRIGVIRNIGSEGAQSFLKIPNVLSGITISNSVLTNVGGLLNGIAGSPCPNIIAGNSGPGILIKGLLSSNNNILSNFIGTSNQGDEGIGNEGDGICIEEEANNNNIGGLLENMQNIISGNQQNGIAIVNGNDNKVLGNLLGLFKDETNQYTRLGNIGNGIYMKNSFANFISKCLISANAGNGIQITGALSQLNKIFGVIIGSDSSAESGLGNMMNGILMDDMAGANTIGGSGEDSSVSIVGSQQYAIKMFNLLSNFQNNIRNAQIGIIRNIGSENPQGFIKIPNMLGGVYMENTMRTLLGSIDVSNLIAGNNGPGVIMKGFSTSLNKLIANIIGTDTTGTPNLGNIGAAIRLINGANNNIIGGENEGESNVCVSTVSGFGIELSNTYNNKITQLLSGVFNDGQTLQVLSNNIGMMLNNCTGTVIKNSLFCGNISDGISVTGTGSSDISISGSRIGTDFAGEVSYGNGGNGVTIAKANNINFSGASASDVNIINGNVGYGVYGNGVSSVHMNNVYAGVDAQANLSIGYKNGKGALKFNSSWGLSLGVGGQVQNIIAGYDSTGIQMINSTGTIENNLITNSSVGIKAIIDTIVGALREKLKIQKNIIRNCVRAIQTDDIPAIYIAGNLIEGNTGIGSGIHIFNSNGKIEGNTIINDAGDAIYLEDQSNPVVFKNNIFDNDGYGLRNIDPSILVNAQGNWWGDPSGPGGQGPGTGDEVSMGVDFQNWRTELASLIVLGGPDTTYQLPGITDTLYASVLNWESPNDIVDITLSDSLGWLSGQASITVTLDDTLGNIFPIVISAPGNTPPNTVNKVTIDAVSQINTNQTDDDDFYVIIYSPELVRIVLSPDSASITLGDSLQFTAIGYDQLNQPISFTAEWDTYLGSITNNGLYITPAVSGTDTVMVTDPVTQILEKAVVVINDPTEVKDNEQLLPVEYKLSQNYPNPFNPSTKIRFALPESGNVKLEVYNILGERVASLVNDAMSAGYHEVKLNAESLSSGVYFYRIQVNQFIDIKKMILLK